MAGVGTCASRNYWFQEVCNVTSFIFYTVATRWNHFLCWLFRKYSQILYHSFIQHSLSSKAIQDHCGIWPHERRTEPINPKPWFSTLHTFPISFIIVTESFLRTMLNYLNVNSWIKIQFLNQTLSAYYSLTPLWAHYPIRILNNSMCVVLRARNVDTPKALRATPTIFVHFRTPGLFILSVQVFSLFAHHISYMVSTSCSQILLPWSLIGFCLLLMSFYLNSLTFAKSGECDSNSHEPRFCSVLFLAA